MDELPQDKTELPPEPSEQELDEAESDPVTYTLEEVWEKIHRGENL